MYILKKTLFREQISFPDEIVLKTESGYAVRKYRTGDMK